MKLFYLAGGIGVILALVGLLKLVANLRFLARTTAVKGTLVKWDITEPGAIGGPDSTKGRRSYRPIVAYRAADGSSHQVMGGTFRQARSAPASAGTPFPVRYDKAKPADAQVATFTDFWMFPIASLGIGAFCIVIAVNNYQ